MSVTDTAANMALSDAVPILFEIKHANGIWTVTKDYVFWGDFTHQSFAMEAIETAVSEITAQGGTAQIVTETV